MCVHRGGVKGSQVRKVFLGAPSTRNIQEPFIQPQDGSEVAATSAMIEITHNNRL
jgi:hypothetical protein